MTTQPAERPRVTPIDPDSERGQHVARELGVIAAAVVARLRREGIAIPGESLDP